MRRTSQYSGSAIRVRQGVAVAGRVDRRAGGRLLPAGSAAPAEQPALDRLTVRPAGPEHQVGTHLAFRSRWAGKHFLIATVASQLPSARPAGYPASTSSRETARGQWRV